jgi:hypothetical protein
LQKQFCNPYTTNTGFTALVTKGLQREAFTRT